MNGTDENGKQVIDGATGAVIDTPRSGKPIKLSDLRDVRLELAAVYRKMKAGEIKTQDGTRMAFVLKTIANVIVSADLERRITELEEARERQLESARTGRHAALPFQH
jgi:signal transduction protein with GAF and PtsI domain